MVDRWCRRSVLAAGLALAVAFGSTRAAGATDGPADVFVATLADQVIAALRVPAASERERLRRVDVLTAGAFDLDRTARIALGRYWKVAAEADRREFADLFKAYVLTSYGRRFHQFADRTFRVAGVTPAHEDVLVESRVEGGATPIRLDWRLTATAAGWRVLDVSVEGVSLLLTFRNEFAAVIERSGGELGGLIEELRTRVAAEQAPLAS